MGMHTSVTVIQLKSSSLGPFKPTLKDHTKTTQAQGVVTIFRPYLVCKYVLVV